MLGWLRTTFAAFEIRDFRILWLGTIFSFVAFFMSTVVQHVVAFELTGTNGAVGYVVSAQGVAMALLGPLGGAYADRWPKRRVVVGVQPPLRKSDPGPSRPGSYCISTAGCVVLPKHRIALRACVAI